jgi:hypothetical protein
MPATPAGMKASLPPETRSRSESLTLRTAMSRNPERTKGILALRVTSAAAATLTRLRRLTLHEPLPEPRAVVALLAGIPDRIQIGEDLAGGFEPAAAPRVAKLRSLRSRLAALPALPNVRSLRTRKLLGLAVRVAAIRAGFSFFAHS